MEILANPSFSTVIPEDYRRLRSSGQVLLQRTELFRSSSRKPVKLKFLHSDSSLKPVRLSSSTQSPQVDLDTAESGYLETDSSKTVHVRLLLQKECLFGEHFFIVGNDPIFGLWEPENAIPLNWSNGHVWTLELDIPIGKSIEFKILLKGNDGEILWQPGANRVFKTWETNNTITIYEDWESAELQKVSTEELVLVNQDSPMVAQNVNNGSPVLDTDTEAETKYDSGTLGEKPMAIVADNISLPTDDDSPVKLTSDILDESKKENCGESPVFSDKIAAAENTVSHNGAPVLVPGLTPTCTEEKSDDVPEDDNKKEEEVSNMNVSAAGDGDAKTHGSSELEKKQDTEDTTQAGSMEMLINRAEQRNHHRQALEEFRLPEFKLLDSKVLENDIQWGRRTLRKLLNGLGLL